MLEYCVLYQPCIRLINFFFRLNQSARAAHLKSALLPHHSSLLFDGNLEITPTVVRTRDTVEATSKKHCLVASGDATSAAINNGPCTSSPAPSAAHVGQQSRGPTQAASSGRVQNHLAHGTAPVRYVNFLVYEGYSVEVIGGKHFKTPDGEFVEMKSGTQYKIHVKNSHPYGKRQTHIFSVCELHKSIT